MLHDVDGVFVEGAAHEAKVGEDERLLDVEAESNDVLGILKSTNIMTVKIYVKNDLSLLFTLFNIVHQKLWPFLKPVYFSGSI